MQAIDEETLKSQIEYARLSGVPISEDEAERMLLSPAAQRRIYFDNLNYRTQLMQSITGRNHLQLIPDAQPSD